MIENPFSISYNVFDGIADDATLYVPQGTKGAYESAGGWPIWLFSNIVEFDATGITDTPTERANGDVFYNLNGVRVDRPTNGLYIKNGKKVMVK